MARIALIEAAELSPDNVRRIELEGHTPVAVYNLGGEFFVTDDLCTHGEASLADGEIEFGTIVCPFHLGAFDIRSGVAVAPPCVAPLRTYAVTVEAGMVYLILGE